MKKYVDLFVKAAMAYIFWRPSIGSSMVRWSIALLIALLAGFSLTVGIPTGAGRFNFAFDSSTGTSGLLFNIALAIDIILFAVGMTLILRDAARETRRKILVIELLGLRDISAPPLVRAVPKRARGRREPILVDIRQGTDGKLVAPEEALSRTLAIPYLLSAHTAGHERDDLEYIAAALAPVPFAFLLGVLLDDESPVEIIDWDRNALVWRKLDQPDDGERFAVTGLDALGDAEEAVIAISFSYPVDRPAIDETFSGFPLILLTLPTPRINGHWSAEKQTALAEQFFDVARQVCGGRLRKIHLVLAAPASIAIRFGRTYDIRNLPNLIVYQYERNGIPPYPWGVSMPVANEQAEIVKR